MASATRICKVCGKEYEYCRTNLPTAFRWQDVACCREHALEYFALIEATRAGTNKQEPVAKKEDAPNQNVEEAVETRTKARRSRRRQTD